MALKKYKLGELIELRGVVNKDLKFGINDVRGVNNLKQFMDTKADLNGRDLSKFQIVYPSEFVFNHRTSRNGSKFSIAYSREDKPVICTEDYVVFRVNDEGKKIIDSTWLYIFFNRPEFDRYVITNSWGSSTEFFNWEDLCDIEIDLPSLDVQQKYVNIYNAMLKNQQAYERGLEDLKSSYETLIEDFKHKSPRLAIGDILYETDKRNADNKVTNVQGINIEKNFMPTVADTNGVKLSNYKVVKSGQFAFSGMQTGRDECIRIALFDKEVPIIISPAYSVLENKNKDVLSEYVMMWFSRKEIDRLGCFLSDGSIRTNLDMDRFYEISIPVPDIKKQQSVVDIYKVYKQRKFINERMKAQIKDICPILIKGSIEEGRKMN